MVSWGPRRPHPGPDPACSVLRREVHVELRRAGSSQHSPAQVHSRCKVAYWGSSRSARAAEPSRVHRCPWSKWPCSCAENIPKRGEGDGPQPTDAGPHTGLRGGEGETVAPEGQGHGFGAWLLGWEQLWALSIKDMPCVEGMMAPLECMGVPVCQPSSEMVRMEGDKNGAEPTCPSRNRGCCTQLLSRCGMATPSFAALALVDRTGASAGLRVASESKSVNE